MRRIQRTLKRLKRFHGLLLFALLTGTMALVCLQLSRSRHSSSHGTPVIHEGPGESSVAASRMLNTAAAKHHHVLASPPSQLHVFLVLDSEEQGSSHLKQLDPYLAPYRKHPEAVAITQITGVAATSLAGQFSIAASALPAVVYLPPMWQSGAHFTEAATFSLGRDAAGAADVTNWARSKSRMALLLKNDWDGMDICFYFVTNNDRHEEVEIGCTATQEEMWQDVSLLDTFTARNKAGRALLAQHVALFTGIFVVQPPGFCQYLANRTCELPKLPHPTDPEILSQREANEQKRIAELKELPTAVPHFTTVGFEKQRAPEEVIQALRGYLNASWDNLVRELWHDDDIFTNHYDSPSLLADLPWTGLTTRIIKTVQTLLEAWIGGIPLQHTAIYGIRIYSANSTLLMHCDRRDTHLVSTIVNVLQDVDEPWPLHILDHAGKLHAVTMQPGDLVKYEGASCGHGRPDPLKGRFYANLFIHFKPAASPQQ